MFILKEKANIEETIKYTRIDKDVQLFTRILKGDFSGKTAIFIHGGGSGGNHTMLLRPAKWMIIKKIFSSIIMPDKRGEGKSSMITQKMSIRDHAEDIKKLLNSHEISEKVTAMGISYGGPVVLTLASIDERIDEVVLFASSPSLNSAKGITGILNNLNLLEPIVKVFYKKTVGKSPSHYTNLDCIYDIQNKNQLNKIFLDAIKSTEKSRLESLLLQNAATLDHKNNSIETDIHLNIPIYQIIGDRDEIWETDLSEYSDRFPKLHCCTVNNADHKDSLLRAEEFYKNFSRIYQN